MDRGAVDAPHPKRAGRRRIHFQVLPARAGHTGGGCGQCEASDVSGLRGFEEGAWDAGGFRVEGHSGEEGGGGDDGTGGIGHLKHAW